MKLPTHSRPGGRAADHQGRRGAALMLSLLVLLILVAVVFQLNIATSTDARVARNDIVHTAMDLAMESVLLDQFEVLKNDLADDEAAGGPDAGAGSTAGSLLGGLGGAGGLGGGGGDAGDGEEGPTDSRRDDWAKPGRADAVGRANGINVRILIQDENSKYNVLTMLTEDEEEAEKAYLRVVRIIDLFREGTDVDIDTGDAERIARLMREHLRSETEAARPRLVTDDPEERDLRKPMLSLVEIEQYEEIGRIEASVGAPLFRDFRTEDDEIVHSLTSYLTTWSAIQTLQDFLGQQEAEAGAGAGGATPGDGITGAEGGAGQTATNNDNAVGGTVGTTGGVAQSADGSGAQTFGQGGGEGGPVVGAVNLNTAPPVVLKAMMDEDDVDGRFWDEVIAYRNEEDEEAMDETEDEEPPLDEFGEEIILFKYFSSPDQLGDMRDWDVIEPEIRDDLIRLVGVESNVFTIYLTARKDTSGRAAAVGVMSRDEIEEQERLPTNISRTIACTVWRTTYNDEVVIVPLQRWEYLDYVPWEVLDYPGEER